MKFLLVSPKNRTVYNFRGDLIKEIVKKGYEVIVTGPDWTDVEKIEALGAKFAQIPMDKTGTNVISDLKYCRTLYQLIQREKPDATLGYTVKPAIYGAVAAHFAGVQNVSSMVTGGGYTFTAASLKAKILGFIVRCLYRIGLGYADHVIFQNPDDLNEFCARGLVKRDKCSVVNGSGVNVRHYATASFPKEITFFMLSRLLKSKGVQEYLEAADIVKKKYPQARFCLLGKYETTMQDAVPQERIEVYIKRGTVERFKETHDVRPYYAMCSVYVLPSYREGTPRTVLEAMSMGRPIITTDTQGCRETVVDGENGYLVPVKDSKTLAEKMICFIEKSDLVESMGKKSREYALRKFDVNKVNSDMLEIMQL
ncbi:MAG: glycosyltransferase family 4 protein [Oscillospiraceae bacterium]|nr:glycosyltransferase family 4 protein [Oscillospiraceae bacterium]